MKLLVAALVLSPTLALSSSFTKLSGAYFGQTPPGDEARLFMPGLISTHGRNGNIAFLDHGKACVFTTDETGTRSTYLESGHWTTPQLVPWAFVQGISDHTLGGDGKTFYWQSRKLLGPSDTKKEQNIWTSQWLEGDWTEPAPLPEAVNSPESDEVYPTATAEGSVYYFSHDRDDSLREDIYFNRRLGGRYSATQRAPWPLNSAYGELDLFVAPDESYIIFASDRPGGYGQCDNYICFRRPDGSWTHPINMGSAVNSYANEIRSFVTPGGEYLFFGSTREASVSKGTEGLGSELAARYGDNDVYWIGGSVIADLEEQLRTRGCAAELVRRELTARGTRAAIARLQQLRAMEETQYHFSLFELLDVAEGLLAGGRPEEAELYVAALRDLFDDFRVRHGYAIILVTNGQVEEGASLLEALEASGARMDLATTLDFLYYDLSGVGKVEDAISLLKRKIARFPEAYFSYCYLATMYERLGDTEKARAACQAAIELEPGFSDAKRILARLGPTAPAPQP